MKDKLTKVLKSHRFIILFITGIVLVGKVLGFFREILMADGFGASAVVDAFLTAESVSTIFLGWLLSFSVVFTPIYQEVVIRKGNEKGDRYTGNLVLLVEVLAFLAIIICLIARPLLINLCAPGFDDETKLLTEKFLVIVVWIQLISTPVNIFCAYLNCKNMQLESNLAILVLSVFNLIGVVAACYLQNPMFMAYGLVIANVLEYIYVFLLLIKARFKFRPDTSAIAELKQSMGMVFPVFISSMIAEINIFFDKFFASFLQEGTVSVLHYASRIRILFSYVFSTILQSVFYPQLSALAVDEDRCKFKRYVSDGMEMVSFIFIPLTGGCLALAAPMVEVIYKRGAFSQEALAIITTIFFCYSLSLVPLAIRDLLTRAVYALKKTRYSIYIGVAGVVTNVIFNAILIKPLKHDGLALATGIAAVVSMILFGYALHREEGRFLNKKFWIEIFKSTVATIIMTLAVWGLYQVLDNTFMSDNKMVILFEMIICAIVGIILYTLLSYLMKSTALRRILKRTGK